uniref:Uncharacterized protein n=1 Tax=Daphnia galeata TaxID=27404 RepID=A0A8J2WKP0_9CRUS|nr:unnamed protein product [Daphnia galeata]
MSNIVDYHPSLAEPSGGEKFLDGCWYSLRRFRKNRLQRLEKMEHFLLLIRAHRGLRWHALALFSQFSSQLSLTSLSCRSNKLFLQRPMEHYNLWLVNTLLICFIVNYVISKTDTSSIKRSDYYDYSWSNPPPRPPFFHSWRNEYHGRKMWSFDRPEPPRSPFHPEELPIGLRSPFQGFRESIYEKVIVPHLRGNSSPSREKNLKNFDRNVLFRHEVEKSNLYKPRKYYAESLLASEKDYRHEMEEPNAKSYSFEKPFHRGTGSLPLSDTKKPRSYSEFIFHPY